MELLEKSIKEKGKVLSGNVLKVGSFLNNQIDIRLATAMGKEILEHFKDKRINKILTIEASGIAIACITAQFFDCNVVFANKNKTANVTGDVYSSKAFSFTHNTTNTILVTKEYLSEKDNVLLLDDFLANGEAINALMDIVEQSGASLKGVAIEIEKGFQGAGDKLREQGVDLFSLAVIDKMDENEIVFRT
ncbi:MAG: xanthine phosphoribosyltransferase [Clostridia bacterium]|nr:xanthine phosphoribosyltransferase [Clostridia bacterium]